MDLSKDSGIEWRLQAAAEEGDLEAFKTHLGDAPVSSLHVDIITLAAANGHQTMLHWLHSEGAPWDENACANAAFFGHLDVLKWLREAGAARGTSARFKMLSPRRGALSGPGRRRMAALQ